MAQVLEWTGQALSVSSQGHDMVFMGVRRGLTEEGDPEGGHSLQAPFLHPYSQQIPWAPVTQQVLRLAPGTL